MCNILRVYLQLVFCGFATFIKLGIMTYEWALKVPFPLTSLKWSFSREKKFVVYIIQILITCDLIISAEK